MKYGFSLRRAFFQALVLGLFFCAFGTEEASAATYYASASGSGSSCTQGTPCSLTTGVSTLASGDTLILADGTYNTAISGIPNGSAGSYTTIKAQNDGGAVITQAFVMTHTNAYISFEGLKFSGAYSKGILGNHIKFLRCSFHGGEPSGNVSSVVIGTNDYNDTAYILIEDSWVYGEGGRYNILVYNANYVVLRRNVVRHDGGWTDSKGDPEAAVCIYNSSYVEVQNNLVVDSDLGTYHTWNQAFYFVYNSASPNATTHLAVRGNIVLNNIYNAYRTDGNGTVSFDTFSDNVAYDLTPVGDGYAFVNGGSSATVVWPVTRSVGGSLGYGVGHWGGGTPTISDSILFDVTSADTAGGWSMSYLDRYNVGSSGTCSNCSSYNPRTNGLLYLPRIESGSTLATGGQSGGRIGADITKKIGTSGTLYGETGYATTTTDNLWPWPNEARIKSDMAAVSARGFATGTSMDGSSQTLTKYIWEYLGNQIPADIYGTSTTYYISPSGSDSASGTTSGTPWKTFSKAFSTMAAGDELILLDGTYSEAAGTGYISYLGTNSAQVPSGTSSSNMTYVHAQNPGSVRITGDLFVGRSTRKDSYIKIQGITFTGGGQLYNTSYVTIKDCGFDGAFGIGTNDHNNGNTDNLIEDAWIWASGERIVASNYRADRNVWRRVVVRGDGCGTVSCTGSGNPNVGFTVYESADVSVQNMLVVDRILSAGDEPYADFAVAQHTVGYPFGRSEWLGTMSVNSEDAGYYMEPDDALDPSIKISNAAAINDPVGFNIARVDHNNELENLTAVINGSGDGVRVVTTNSSGTLVNALVTGIGRYGINSAYTPSYASVSGTLTSSYNQTSCSTGCYTANPRSNGTLLYPTRIESGSQLKGVGSATGASTDIGANVVYRYGTDGTHYGESGYNTLSGTALWAWPNQDRIKDEMCTDAGETRGFCASGNGLYGGAVTLTSYIWESLGNACPSDVCPTGADTTAPTVTNVSSDTANGTYNAGDTIDIDVTFSEAVTSTGSVTVTLETGTTDRTCTFTVSNSTTGTCNYTVQATDTSSDLTVNSITGTVADAASNPMTSPATPTTNLAANKALVIDTTAPTNQNTVFAASTTKAGGATVTIVSSGDATNSVWFAPSGTSTFSAGATMTTAGGTATSILAPATAGSYKLYVIDAAGNASSASTATLTVDNTAPTRSGGSPSGALVSGTTSTTMSLTTDENATCKYATSSGTAYASMASTFTTTGTTSHSTTISGLSDGTSYTYYVRCQDTPGNQNASDYSISFSISTTSDVTAPSVPTDLAGSAASQSQINLSWTASTDDTAVSTYEVYRNGTQIGSTASTSYQDTGLAAGTAYLYSVLAKDASNNPSAQTSQVSVTTQSAAVSSSSSSGGGGGGGSKKKKKKSVSGKIIVRPGERTAPWVTLIAPKVGTVLPKRFTVSAVSSDRSGIQAMIVTQNGTRKKRSNQGSVSYTLARKNMTVAVNAYDTLGNRKTVELRVVGGKVVGVRYY